MAKINYTVVKINFHGGKNHFYPLCHPQTSVPAILALILLVGGQQYLENGAYLISQVQLAIRGDSTYLIG